LQFLEGKAPAVSSSGGVDEGSRSAAVVDPELNEKE